MTYPWKHDPNATWWQNHDGEVLVWSLYLVLKFLAYFTTPDQHPYLYATFHGHADDVFGAGVMLIVIKYCWEKTSD